MTHIVTNEIPVSIDKLRFERLMQGWTVEGLAALEGVQVQTVQASVDRAARREHMIIQFEIVQMKQQGALQNERFRVRLREKLADKVAHAIGVLLSGQRDQLTVDKATGKVAIEHVIDDPETMAAGVIEYRKFASLEEKPAAAGTVQVENNAVVKPGR